MLRVRPTLRICLVLLASDDYWSGARPEAVAAMRLEPYRHALHIAVSVTTPRFSFSFPISPFLAFFSSGTSGGLILFAHCYVSDAPSSIFFDNFIMGHADVASAARLCLCICYVFIFSPMPCRFFVSFPAFSPQTTIFNVCCRIVQFWSCIRIHLTFGLAHPFSYSSVRLSGGSCRGDIFFILCFSTSNEKWW